LFVLLLFLFSCIVINLAIPSFPTRRSSDLIVADVLPGKGGVKLALGTERGAAALDVQMKNGEFVEDVDGSGGAVTNVLCAGLRLDRKSTRLNSSHQIISYAVFCLKKNNIKR